ncbi:UDP-2,4-diacetamido-2,4,6-trideoxy-beta-L-altropyranose hydrolase [Pontibacter chitinilyticus]|uniref:UDP-2,4-diacetamido-2,4, 6-trideoxy-beta-L-altropyranose hydrolase n=1 Tax=Pontibacter chitinilyticus TaxID=2674989 RepID=UPI003218E628
MTNKTRIIFRADGNSRIGLGHVVRSLALAQMLREEFECVFAIQQPGQALQEQIKQVCHGLIILPACTPEEDRFIHELEAYIAPDVLVVLDGYTFGTAYQQNLKSKGCLLICIDDIHAYPFVADVVLNQAGGVEAAAYTTATYTKLLLGPTYALLRHPFLQAAKATRTFPAAPLRVLLNMGGADPENHTLRVAQSISQWPGISTIEVVVGSAYKHRQELQQWLGQQPNCILHQNLSATAMCQLMQVCALAVTSASGIAYEYAAVGGMLYILQTAANQQALYDFLTSTGIARPYEHLEKQTTLPEKQVFDEQVAVQRQHFDGKSDIRLKQVFDALRLQTSLRLRVATENDMLLLHQWNNDPEVRSRSFNPEPISLESHSHWFTAKLADPNSIIYLAIVEGEPAAQLRFELNSTTATISYLISKAYRGKGLSHTLLLKGIGKLNHQRPGLRIVEGLVQPENTASIRAFEKAGFLNGTAAPQHPGAHRYVLELTPPKEV